MGPDVTLKIEATMPERWASQFLGMLEAMRYNGSIGHSGNVIFFADGDGDFRPKFVISDPPNIEIAEGFRVADIGVRLFGEDVFFDAG